MLNPLSLRLNSPVLHNGEVKYIYELGRRYAVFQKTIDGKPAVESVAYEKLEGVPLSGELLERLGLKRQKSGIGGADMWQGMDAWSINNPYFEGWLFRGNPKHGLKLVGYFNSNITTLHQLLNLIADLTGEELKIDI